MNKKVSDERNLKEKIKNFMYYYLKRKRNPVILCYYKEEFF